MPLSAHHSPLIIFSASPNIKVQAINNFGNQLDIYPTIMGLLNISYINNTLGMEIPCDKQPYAVFNSDDVAGCLSDKYFLVRQSDGRESIEVPTDLSIKINLMERILQTTDRLIHNSRFYEYAFR